METNPYEAPQTVDESAGPSPWLSGRALAKDTAALLAAGLVASVVGVPLLFLLFLFIQIALEILGWPPL